MHPTFLSSAFAKHSGNEVVSHPVIVWGKLLLIADVLCTTKYEATDHLNETNSDQS